MFTFKNETEIKQHRTELIKELISIPFNTLFNKFELLGYKEREKIPNKEYLFYVFIMLAKIEIGQLTEIDKNNLINSNYPENLENGAYPVIWISNSKTILSNADLRGINRRLVKMGLASECKLSMHRGGSLNFNFQAVSKSFFRVEDINCSKLTEKGWDLLKKLKDKSSDNGNTFDKMSF